VSKQSTPASRTTIDHVSRRAQRHHQRIVRRRRRLALAIGGGIVALGVVVGVVVGGTGGDGGDDPTSVGTVARLELGEYFIRGDLEVPAGNVTLSAVNVGAIAHNVGIRGGPITNSFGSGEEKTVDLGILAPGAYELYCDITGHVENGMVATLTVTAAEPPASGAAPTT
jgi:plastocyanin